MLKAIQGSAFAKRARTYLRSNDRGARLLALAAAMLVISAPAHAAAGGGGDITAFLQNLVNVVTGTLGQLLAVIAVVGVGVGALFGAFSFRAVGGVIIGVMLIFSSSWVVQQIIA